MKIPRVVTSEERFSLKNKRALIYGAGCGIGRAIAHEFLSAGAEVIGVDVDAAGLSETEQTSPKTMASCVADVTNDEDVRTLTAEHFDASRPCDVLVYSAATRYRSERVVDMKLTDWRRQIDVNLTGAFVCVHHAIPTMTRGGSVILIASQLGSVAAPGAPAYCASKGALIQFAKALAVDHTVDNIRANTLSPGAIGTQRLEARFGSIEQANSVLGPRHLAGRVGIADEVVGAARFLASDASLFMTGADLLVDGGYNSH